jgi:hypothetical protein
MGHSHRSADQNLKFTPAHVRRVDELHTDLRSRLDVSFQLIFLLEEADHETKQVYATAAYIHSLATKIRNLKPQHLKPHNPTIHLSTPSFLVVRERTEFYLPTDVIFDHIKS